MKTLKNFTVSYLLILVCIKVIHVQESESRSIYVIHDKHASDNSRKVLYISHTNVNCLM